MFSYSFFSIVIQGSLNISSSETPDIQNIQMFVKDYVDEYVGEYDFVNFLLLLLLLLAVFYTLDGLFTAASALN